MKKSHILIIVVIAVAIGIMVSTAGDASTYVNFDEAYKLASAGKTKDIHVVGQLKKDAGGHIVGIEEGADRVSFSFVLVDDAGKEQRVEYDEPMPADMLKSEKVVIVGSYAGERFKASKIILKCPSKYQEQSINA
ncbi:cytochrome c maturation protein CcmE [Parachryseolinea silvisoli]|uniref:cytochrome c maturation protein CcmE n=1 Tax=Parachryseolinea silvisoli TaxID=2873601 RepID=UPI002265DED7|nr:cytochrome c maturation protein CcmE [Parachryseolinea silvisoli]MCD9019608.1 cytochrome c maturation protein CcmE [Parachryseolinea silvisoli]